MLNVIFRGFDEVADELYKYAVIVARYDGKWVFSRHRDRDTWEIPGGHRETGETIEQTAWRELYEETGAVDADVKPVTVYGVVRDGVPTYGVLFFADVKALGPIPDGSEIAEIGLYELIPHNLTYTAIQPPLFRAAQGWLNGQCGKGEIRRVALASRPFINNNIEHNVRAITDAVEAVGGECDLVLFGEAVLQGFDSLSFDYKTDKNIALPSDDPIINDIRDAAKKHSVAVSFGYIERDGDTVYSSQLVIGQNGETLHNYRRVSPGWKEHHADFHYREGESFVVFDYMGKRFAIALCGDLWEDGRADEMRALGADAILWPVYCNYDADEWNSKIKHEYAEQAATAGDDVLLVNPICADPMLLDLLSEPPVLAKGGAAHFQRGKIAAELPAGSDGVIIVEI